jgi:hypothetical protein
MSESPGKKSEGYWVRRRALVGGEARRERQLRTDHLLNWAQVEAQPEEEIACSSARLVKGREGRQRSETSLPNCPAAIKDPMRAAASSSSAQPVSTPLQPPSMAIACLRSFRISGTDAVALRNCCQPVRITELKVKARGQSVHLHGLRRSVGTIRSASISARSWALACSEVSVGKEWEKKRMQVFLLPFVRAQVPFGKRQVPIGKRAAPAFPSSRHTQLHEPQARAAAAAAGRRLSRLLSCLQRPFRTRQRIWQVILDTGARRVR